MPGFILSCGGKSGDPPITKALNKKRRDTWIELKTQFANARRKDGKRVNTRSPRKRGSMRT